MTRKMKPAWNERLVATDRICRRCARDIPDDEGHFNCDTDYELEAPVCFPCLRDHGASDLGPPPVVHHQTSLERSKT